VGTFLSVKNSFFGLKIRNIPETRSYKEFGGFWKRKVKVLKLRDFLYYNTCINHSNMYVFLNSNSYNIVSTAGSYSSMKSKAPSDLRYSQYMTSAEVDDLESGSH
jgi:hypothetical protein